MMELEHRETIAEHLRSRRIEPHRYSTIFIDEEERHATFLVWNLSGQIVGYQKYRPDAEKQMKNDEEVGRYYTYFSGERKQKMVGVWGMETYHYHKDYLCFTEGIFDAAALHNFGVPAVACFSNDPKHLRPWMTILPKKLIGFRDNDSAGAKLEKFMDECVVMNQKDLGDSTDDEIAQILRHKGLLINEIDS